VSVRTLITQSRPGLQLWGLSYRWTLAYVPHKLHLPYVLNQRRLLGIGYEIGVWEGSYSSWLLEHWNGKRLVSVDAWSVETDGVPCGQPVTQAELENRFEATRARLAPYGSRSEIWRAESTEAAVRVAPASADFVYIDARHDYDAVSADIAAWLPRIRPGGLLAGHDYYDGERGGLRYGVKRAVQEACASTGLEITLTRRDHPEQSWLMFLPER
jgi:methyltransferase family protein